MNVRRGIASLDEVLASVRVNEYNAETVVLSWDRKYRRAAVMGLLDANDVPVDVRPDVLARLTGLIVHPLEQDALRLAYPDAKLHYSGQVMLNLPVHQPVWARVLSNVELQVEAGLRVSSDDIRDAISVTLEAAGVPSGTVIAERVLMFPELPDDIQFAPLTLTGQQNGAGDRIDWAKASESFPIPDIPKNITALVNELALRQEREQNLGGGKIVLTRAVVST